MKAVWSHPHHSKLFFSVLYVAAEFSDLPGNIPNSLGSYGCIYEIMRRENGQI